MALSIDNALGSQIRALELRDYRAQLLATNIANADTPNYKAVDLDFKDALSKAQSGDLALMVTDKNQIRLGGENGGNLPVKYRNPLQPSLDGNTVDLHVEQAAFTRNAVQHQAAFMFLSGRIKGIISAIKGQ